MAAHQISLLAGTRLRDPAISGSCVSHHPQALPQWETGVLV